jgi:hypothetical protein
MLSKVKWNLMIEQLNFLKRVDMESKSIINQVKYGLDSVDEKLTVEVNLKKLLFIYKTFEELISFFHQRGHYEHIEDVHTYLGSTKTGMFSILSEIYYREFDEILPDYVKEMLNKDEFYNPVKQYYRARPDLQSSEEIE